MPDKIKDTTTSLPLTGKLGVVSELRVKEPDDEKGASMTTAIILNIIFATVIFATIVGLLAWAIATQSRDHNRPALANSRGIARRRAPAGHRRPAHSQARRIQGRQGHGLA